MKGGIKLELWNRKVGKSLKIGKNRIKSETSNLISYQTFWQKCQNAKMPALQVRVMHQNILLYYNIFKFKRL